MSVQVSVLGMEWSSALAMVLASALASVLGMEWSSVLA